MGCGLALSCSRSFKFLRGTAFDLFGRTEERRTERRLISDYEASMLEMIEDLSADNLSLTTDIASLPEHIRGYGHVKETHIADVAVRRASLIQARKNPIKAYAA